MQSAEANYSLVLVEFSQILAFVDVIGIYIFKKWLYFIFRNALTSLFFFFLIQLLAFSNEYLNKIVL